MSYADQVFRANCLDILQNGVRDDDLTVRPHWEDGTPAHTIKKFGLVNRYDLQKEFPILTLRRTYLKSAVDELLWIWQKKSNNVHDLSSHIWDAWADETGSIGAGYLLSLLGLAVEAGLIDLDLALDNLAVRAELVSGLQEYEISGYELADMDLLELSVADDLGSLLGLLLLLERGCASFLLALAD